MIDKNIAIIDYRLSNLFSVKNACSFVGLKPVITCDKIQIIEADALILPGVGAFGDAMKNLESMGLIEPIKESIKEGKPFMGVCLGMQLLFSESEEFGNHQGLNIIKGKVVRFAGKTKKIKVPQIGWNRIYRYSSGRNEWRQSPLRNIANNEFMYFVHSYYVRPDNKDKILSFTNYEGIEYCSAVKYKNILATQFHPEKSGKEGIKIYADWLSGSTFFNV